MRVARQKVTGVDYERTQTAHKNCRLSLRAGADEEEDKESNGSRKERDRSQRGARLRPENIPIAEGDVSLENLQVQMTQAFQVIKRNVDQGCGGTQTLREEVKAWGTEINAGMTAHKEELNLIKQRVGCAVRPDSGRITRLCQRSSDWISRILKRLL